MRCIRSSRATRSVAPVALDEELADAVGGAQKVMRAAAAGSGARA